MIGSRISTSRFQPGLWLMIGMLVICQGCTNTAKQVSFVTPEDAVDELVRATRTGNRERLQELFGPESDKLLDSGDPVADKEGAERFVEAVDDKYRLVDEPNGSVTLHVGSTDFLFPIPIVLGETGWVFDTKTGLNEIINRRVGRNETDAVQVTRAIVDSQHEYLMLDPDGDGVLSYAQKFISDPGKKNGLFWPAAAGEPESPVGAFVAEAALEGYVFASVNPTPLTPRPYHGYRYRILTSQGPNATGGEINYMIGDRMIAGFGVVAYPAEYGNSGVMTFITNQDGVVYQRDLGAQTPTVAGTMTTFDPGPGWKPVVDED